MKLPSEQKLQTILRSLGPEISSPTARSRASLAEEGDYLVLKIEAKDTVALRAALNSYLRWINAILNVFQTLEREEGRSALKPEI
ncbi:MAG TPA: KEOPS complex subunit Pcc1 [candidate division Zixibacteria bacterium]|nr:KEOPS complex subunit Pcc1 [candidate division Zixibacteria bacterium]